MPGLKRCAGADDVRAPSRVKMRSAGDKVAAAAGTQQPIWARMTAAHVARSRVLLPPMLGPVSSRARQASPLLHPMLSCVSRETMQAVKLLQGPISHARVDQASCKAQSEAAAASGLALWTMMPT